MTSMYIFDGVAWASQRETLLKTRVQSIVTQGKIPTIAAIYFNEDAGSVLYTRKKKEFAQRVGISYQQFESSFGTDPQQVRQLINQLNTDPAVTGIIIQKPAKKIWETWQEQQGRVLQKEDFNLWWRALVAELELNKDVDGLHPVTLSNIEQGIWQQEHNVLPATVRAVLYIMQEFDSLEQGRGRSSIFSSPTLVLGKSDILGLPLYYQLRNLGTPVEIFGSDQLKQRVGDGRNLFDKKVIISATGRAGLIRGEWLSTQTTLIDVGEPQGDVDTTTVYSKVSYLTPVPGGVGPVTVVSLLENCLDLVSWQ